MLRIATDVGGTFTDLVSFDEETNKVTVSKSSTTPKNFALGIMDTINKAKLEIQNTNYFVHGSTIFINALCERKGAKTGLITTKGFRDVLEIGRANRPDLYNMFYKKPTPFVSRFLRLEVTERVDFQGNLLEKLDETELAKSIEIFQKHNVQAVAVCFLNSFLNPENEIVCGKLLREKLQNVPITLSHELTNEWREYERTSTTVLNSYVCPIAHHYLRSLEEELLKKGMPDKVAHIMQSNGGTCSFDHGKQKPINSVESGPVAGVIASSIIGQLIGEENVMSLDIGGTTVKCSLIENGIPKITTDYRLRGEEEVSAGYPIKVPTIDIVELGSGGGSIAWLDQANALHVGPISAGAEPGPSCYGLGGDKPTVTDANVLTGRINPKYFSGGNLQIFPEKSKKAIETLKTRFSEMSADEIAMGMIKIADSNMVNAIKLVSVRRGYDPRKFVVIAFGGGGPMHAAALARQLKVKKIIIPNDPGVFSAWGMIMTGSRQDYIRTWVRRTDQVTLEEVNQQMDQMEKQAITELLDQQKHREKKDEILIQRWADMRYLGQEHTAKVSIPLGKLDQESIKLINTRFHAVHESLYSYKLDESNPIEFVNLHLTGYVKRVPKLSELDNNGKSLEKAYKGEREVRFDPEGVLKAKIYERGFLPSQTKIEGPAVIEEPTSTTVVFPNQELFVDRYGFLHISEKDIEKVEQNSQIQLKLSKSVDPFTAEIIKDNLIAISDEMFINMQRTSMSPIIYEVLDFACGILDPRGRIISQGNGVSGFLGTLTAAVKTVIDKFGPEKLDEGDIIITNDPYTGGGTHLSDVCLVYPIFYPDPENPERKKIVAFSANKAHWTEVGGANAGSWSTDTTDIYQEGLQFPCIKIFKKGVVIDSLVDLISANVRTPKMSIADMYSQIGSIRMAGVRFCEMCSKFSLEAVETAVEGFMKYGEKMTKFALANLPKKNV
eukprot:Anaeramoba_ignava/c21165_g1_i1.p1 GENE.c21165_g1_i1~~c21165_g1_i1.p1  ORF type:complete len:968 (+),score=265.80 c21165_g1_i1:56-2905(+)